MAIGQNLLISPFVSFFGDKPILSPHFFGGDSPLRQSCSRSYGCLLGTVLPVFELKPRSGKPHFSPMTPRSAPANKRPPAGFPRDSSEQMDVASDWHCIPFLSISLSSEKSMCCLGPSWYHLTWGWDMRLQALCFRLRPAVFSPWKGSYARKGPLSMGPVHRKCVVFLLGQNEMGCCYAIGIPKIWAIYISANVFFLKKMWSHWGLLVHCRQIFGSQAAPRPAASQAGLVAQPSHSLQLWRLLPCGYWKQRRQEVTMSWLSGIWLMNMFGDCAWLGWPFQPGYLLVDVWPKQIHQSHLGRLLLLFWASRFRLGFQGWHRWSRRGFPRIARLRSFGGRYLLLLSDLSQLLFGQLDISIQGTCQEL